MVELVNIPLCSNFSYYVEKIKAYTDKQMDIIIIPDRAIVFYFFIF